jgi:hypothetical protein
MTLKVINFIFFKLSCSSYKIPINFAEIDKLISNSCRNATVLAQRKQLLKVIKHGKSLLQDLFLFLLFVYFYGCSDKYIMIAASRQIE